MTIRTNTETTQVAINDSNMSLVNLNNNDNTHLFELETIMNPVKNEYSFNIDQAV
jgi:hypothetical protein